MSKYSKILQPGELAFVNGYGPHTYKGFCDGLIGLVIKREGLGFLFLACPENKTEAKLMWISTINLKRLTLE